MTEISASVNRDTNSDAIAAALYLDGFGAGFLHKAQRIANALLHILVIGSVGHVRGQQSTPHPTAHCAGTQ